METTKELTKQEKYSMNIKDIAASIRESLKKEFPKCKFSVSIERYSMGQSMTIALMSAPFEAFSVPSERNYSQVNHYHLKQSENYTEEAKAVLLRAYELSNHFNYNDSDAQTDYFDVNFYLHLEIGKWNKPFQVTK